MPRVIEKSDVAPIYIGLDPGKQGGLVALCERVIWYSVMPESELDVWQWFQKLPELSRGNVHGLVERVHSMPDQSAQSGFTFGQGYGCLRMALTAAAISWNDITPQAWMKSLQIPLSGKQSKSEKKLKLLAVAKQLYPKLPLWAEKNSKGKQLAICDALLIAHCCKLQHERE